MEGADDDAVADAEMVGPRLAIVEEGDQFDVDADVEEKEDDPGR